MAKIVLLVIDGLGCGFQEDSHLYGDHGANTLMHVVDRMRPQLPNFGRLGLGNILPLASVPAVENAEAAFGRMRERSAGKDSTTGHWEMAGIVLDQPFPTFPEGFPEPVLHIVREETGSERLLCNRPYSGSQVILDFGDEHLATGAPILYTSADSVLQIAAHVDVVPVSLLYSWCEQIRARLLEGPHAVGRVIARPFEGETGQYRRVAEKRRDYSLLPPSPNLLTRLGEARVLRVSVGKVADLFAHQGFDESHKTEGNADGIDRLIAALRTPRPAENVFVFVNLIDTDQLYGHRNDVPGYAACLEAIDARLPEICACLGRDDVMIITGDHGNDPTHPGTDHTREFVPLLVWPRDSAATKKLGTIDGFACVTDSVLRRWGLPTSSNSSFLQPSVHPVG